MVVRAKFKVTAIKKTESGDFIEMGPVTGGSAENEQFFKWTPSGLLTMGIVHEAAARQFEVGKTYYVDFTEATAEAAAP